MWGDLPTVLLWGDLPTTPPLDGSVGGSGDRPQLKSLSTIHSPLPTNHSPLTTNHSPSPPLVQQDIQPRALVVIWLDEDIQAPVTVEIG